MNIIYEDDFEKIEIDNKNQIRYYNKKKKRYKKMSDYFIKNLISDLQEQGIDLTFKLNIMWYNISTL